MSKAASCATVEAWDVAVIGAGPAGSLAALLAARAGLRVVLLEKDRFPRYKVCGCCINGAALACLNAAQLGDLPSRLGAHRLTSYALASGGQNVRLSLQAGVAVSRAAFDAALVQEAVAAGVAFRSGCRVMGTSLEPGSGSKLRLVEVQSNTGTTTLAARVVLAAGGLGALHASRVHELQRDSGSPAADPDRPQAAPGSYLGAGWIAASAPDEYAPGCIYMACGPQGYVGWVRLEDGRLNFAAALAPAAVKQAGGLHAAATAVLQAALPAGWSRPLDRNSPAEWRGTPMLTQEGGPPAAERLFVLGDQAGYVEPFTGEGIAWALESALQVQPLVQAAARRAGPWEPTWSAAWISQQGENRARRQRLCRWVAGSLRHPRLVQIAIRLLSGWPHLADPLLHALNSTPSVATTSLAMAREVR